MVLGITCIHSIDKQTFVDIVMNQWTITVILLMCCVGGALSIGSWSNLFRARPPSSEKQPIRDNKMSKLTAKPSELPVENYEMPINKSELPIKKPETAAEPIKIRDFAHPENSLGGMGIYGANIRIGRPNPIHRQAEVEGKDIADELQSVANEKIIQKFDQRIEQLKTDLEKEKKKYSRLPRNKQTALNETPQWDIENKIKELEERKRRLQEK